MPDKIDNIIESYNKKLERKKNILSGYDLSVGVSLNEIEYANKEVLLAEISLLKIMIDDLEFIKKELEEI